MLSILQHVWAHHTCHREAIFLVFLSQCFLLSTRNTNTHAHDNTKDSICNWASKMSLDNQWQQVRNIKPPSAVNIVLDGASIFYSVLKLTF
jgi:hypothetical protein